MFRRDLLRSLMATPLAGWLSPCVPRVTFGGEASPEPNAAAVYRRAFGWAEGLAPDDVARLSSVATIVIDDRHIGALIRQAQPVLEAIREAAAIGRCRWEAESLSCEGLGKGRLSVS